MNVRPASSTVASPRAFDLVHRVGEHSRDVRGGSGRADRRDCTDLGDLGRGREHGSPAEGVADQQLGCLVLLAQPRCGGDDVVDVRAEVGVRELALAGAETGEVEAQDAEARPGQLGGDARRGP